MGNFNAIALIVHRAGSELIREGNVGGEPVLFASKLGSYNQFAAPCIEHGGQSGGST